MRLSRYVACLGFFVVASQAHAQTPDIVGTWKGVSSASVIGANEHFDTKPDSGARFFQTEFTIVVQEAQGRSFAGMVNSSGSEEPIVGAFRSDLKTGVMSDYDGTYTFELTAPNRLELCYTHAVSATGRSAVAACNELVRQ